MRLHILQRLSHSLLSVEYPSASDVPPNLRAVRRKVNLSFDALRALGEGVGHLSVGGDASLVSPEKDKALTDDSYVDPPPLRSVGVAAPTSAAEVHDMYVQILSQVKSILEVRTFVAGDSFMKLNNYSTTYSFSRIRYIPRFSEFVHQGGTIIRRSPVPKPCVPPNPTGGWVDIHYRQCRPETGLCGCGKGFSHLLPGFPPQANKGTSDSSRSSRGLPLRSSRPKQRGR